MREVGTVTKLVGSERALVEMASSGACNKCRACTFLAGEGKMAVEAQNLVGARVGDRVEVFIPEKNVIWLSFLVYIFPLLGLLAGYWLGATVWPRVAAGRNAEFAGIICGFVGMGLFLGALGVYDKCRRGQLGVRLTKIM